MELGPFEKILFFPPDPLLHTFANNVVQGQLPEYLYKEYCASRLVPANKVHPDQLNPGDIQECRPIIIGNQRDV